MSNLSCGTHVAEPSANKDCRKLLNQFCRFLPKLKLPISADAKLPLTIHRRQLRLQVPDNLLLVPEMLLGVHHLPIPRPYVRILKNHTPQRYSLFL